MDRERAHLPKRARYPLFLVGLLIIIFGNLIVRAENLGANVAEPLSVLGLVFVILSAAIR